MGEWAGAHFATVRMRTHTGAMADIEAAYEAGCRKVASVYGLGDTDLLCATDKRLAVDLRPTEEADVTKRGPKRKRLPAYSDMMDCELPAVSYVASPGPAYMLEYPFQDAGSTAYMAKWAALLGPHAVEVCAQRGAIVLSDAARQHHEYVRKRVQSISLRRQRKPAPAAEPAPHAALLDGLLQVGPALDEDPDYLAILRDVHQTALGGAASDLSRLHERDDVELHAMLPMIEAPHGIPDQLAPRTTSPAIPHSPRKKRRRSEETKQMVVVMRKGDSRPVAVAKDGQLFVPCAQ